MGSRWDALCSARSLGDSAVRRHGSTAIVCSCPPEWQPSGKSARDRENNLGQEGEEGEGWFPPVTGGDPLVTSAWRARPHVTVTAAFGVHAGSPGSRAGGDV